MPPYDGIPFGDLPAGLRHDLGLPKHLLAWAFCHVRACPQSSLTLLSWGGCRNLWGSPAFEPLDRNGLGAQFLSLKGIGWGIFPSHRLMTAGAPFETVSRGDEMTPTVAVVGCGAMSTDGTLLCARG